MFIEFQLLFSKKNISIFLIAQDVRVVIFKQDQFPLTEVTRKADRLTLGCYSAHAAHGDTALQLSPELGVTAGA